MLAIFKREIQAFFTLPVGYLVVGIFLVLNGLFLWVFKGNFNIFDYGLADLGKFFTLAPWVLLFLIPALTMKSFSKEIKLGTLELLLIKPISLWETVLGKFFGTLALALIALAPTVLYAYNISPLGTTIGNLDMGLVIGSYFSFIFLIASYAAIGLFASSLSESQIAAFIITIAICFVLYYGLAEFSTLFPSEHLSVYAKDLGMQSHFEGIALGILDTRDFIYFLSLTLFFLFLTIVQLKNQRR